MGTGTDGTPAGGVWLIRSVCGLAIGTTRSYWAGAWDIRHDSFVLLPPEKNTIFAHATLLRYESTREDRVSCEP